MRVSEEFCSVEGGSRLTTHKVLGPSSLTDVYPEKPLRSKDDIPNQRLYRRFSKSFGTIALISLLALLRGACSRYGSSGSWGAVTVRFGRDLFVSTFIFIYIYVGVRFRFCPWWFQPLCSLVFSRYRSVLLVLSHYQIFAVCQA